jgi:hypothetical protein
MIEVARKSFWVLAILCTLGLSEGDAKAQDAAGKEPPVAKVAASAAAAKIEIAYADGKLSADLKDAEIKDVLKEIGRAVKAKIEIGDGIAGKVTASFQHLSLEDGLAALISGEGTAIVVGYDKKGSVTLIQASKKAGTPPAQVVKVRKVRDYFSPADIASSMDLDEVKELMGILRNPNKKDGWVRAAKQIINIKRPEAKPYLKELIHHEDDFVRDQAMNEYAMLVDVEDADFILEMAKDKSWETRGAAAYISMTLVDDPRQVPVLIEMLNDEKVSVRDAAIRALGFKRSREAVPALEQLLRDLLAKDQDGHTRATAAETLYSITGNKYEWMTPAQKKSFDEEVNEGLERIHKASEQDKK